MSFGPSRLTLTVLFALAHLVTQKFRRSRRARLLKSCRIEDDVPKRDERKSFEMASKRAWLLKSCRILGDVPKRNERKCFEMASDLCRPEPFHVNPY